MIDPVAASLAERHAKAGTFKALEANIAATDSASKLADLSRLDTKFHALIVRAAEEARGRVPPRPTDTAVGSSSPGGSHE